MSSDEYSDHGRPAGQPPADDPSMAALMDLARKTKLISDAATGRDRTAGGVPDPGQLPRWSAVAAGVLPAIAVANRATAHGLTGSGWVDCVICVVVPSLIVAGTRWPAWISDATAHRTAERFPPWLVRTAAVSSSVLLGGWWALTSLPGALGGVLTGWQMAAAVVAAWANVGDGWLAKYRHTRNRQVYMNRWAERVEARDKQARAEVADLRAKAEALMARAIVLMAAAQQAKLEADLAPVAKELAAELADGPDTARQEAAKAGQDADRKAMRDVVARDLLAADPTMSGNAFARQLKAKGYGMSKPDALNLRKVLLIELATEAADEAQTADAAADGS